MTFNDIFKSDFLEKVSSFSILDICIGVLFAFAIGLFIFFVYKKTFKGVLYSHSFGICLVAMTMITTTIIMAVTSNVILSLGMVGALSIVRFRTAIKEPLDIAFLFWAIASGIIIGAGLLPLAVLSAVIMGVVLVLFVNKNTANTPYILVVQCINETVEQSIFQHIISTVKRYQIKSKTISKDNIELAIEISVKNADTQFVNHISNIDGVKSAVLVSYNGEYMS